MSADDVMSDKVQTELFSGSARGINASCFNHLRLVLNN